MILEGAYMVLATLAYIRSENDVLALSDSRAYILTI